jgi:putative transposase
MSEAERQLSLLPQGDADAPLSEDERLLRGLPDRQREAVLAKLDTIRRFQQFEDEAARRGERGQKRLISVFCAQAGPPGVPVPKPNTLYEWLRRHERDGLRGLLDNRGRPSGRGRECHPDAWSFCLNLYLSPKRLSLKYCWELTDAEAKRNGWCWPSEDVVRRRLRAEVPQSSIDYHRLGERRWAARHAPRVQRDYSVFRPNQVWVGDHHEFDCMVEHDGRPIRPWLTAWMDMRSRLLVGWRVAPSPNSDTILLAFRAGVAEYGAPLELTIDNGKDYRVWTFAGGRKRCKASLDAARVRSLCARLEIEPHFTHVYSPQSKPIESFFRTLCGRYAKLFDSYVGGSPDSRPEHVYRDLREGRLDLPTLETFAKVFARWVEENYHRKPHTGDGMDGRSPREVFETCDPIPKRTAPPEILNLLLTARVPAKVGKHGVRYQGVYYGQASPSVRALVGRTVELGIDPADRSKVEIFGVDGRHITTAYEQRLRGSDADDVREAHRRQRAAKRMCKKALPALRDARKPTVQHLIEIQGERLRAEAKATGTDDAVAPRPVTLLPGASGLSGAKSGKSPPAETDDDLTLPERPEPEDDQPEIVLGGNFDDDSCDGEDPLVLGEQ